MTNKLIHGAGMLAAGSLLVAMMAAPALAQSRVRVNIPFAFAAGAEAQPAGNYLIERWDRPGNTVIRVHNVDLNRSITLLTLPAARPMTGDSPRLKFEVLAGEYRLGEVWLPGSEAGAMVPRTKDQALIAKRDTPIKNVVLALMQER